jgi:hypothetical protein
MEILRIAEIVISIMVLFAIVLYFIGRGFAPIFSDIFASENVICLIQRITSHDDDLGIIETVRYRLHIIDNQTGRRLFKKKMGQNDMEVLLLKNEKLMIKVRVPQLPDIFRLMDTKSWQILIEYSNETLPQMFTEFSSGVAEEIDFDNESKLLYAYAKDGKRWYIDANERKILTDKDNQERRQDHIYQNNAPIRLEGDKIKQIQNQRGVIVNPETTFLEGKLLTFNKILKKYIVVSYDTTDKTNPTLHCLNSEHEIIWQVDKNKLKFNSRAKKQADMSVAAFIGDKVVFNYGGVIYLANSQDGNILWQNEIN